MALSDTDDGGIPQLVFYDPGLGTGTGMDVLAGGALGVGIDRNIQQLYTFLAFNYNPGDLVYLCGWSRGAYTVRSLAGLIHVAGLVKRSHATLVSKAYELYRSKVGATSSVARAFRHVHGDAIPIKAVVCFDTVGSLGLPTQYLSSNAERNRYSFHDTALNAAIENGVHVVAVDEERAGFMCTPMTPTDSDRPGQVTTTFFWGLHGDIGGAERPIIADITLRFVLDELSRRECPLATISDAVPLAYPDAAGAPRDPDPPRDGLFSRIYRMFTGLRVRDVQAVDQVHETAVARYKALESWRPKALERWEADILAGRQG